MKVDFRSKNVLPEHPYDRDPVITQTTQSASQSTRVTFGNGETYSIEERIYANQAAIQRNQDRIARLTHPNRNTSVRSPEPDIMSIPRSEINRSKIAIARDRRQKENWTRLKNGELGDTTVESLQTLSKLNKKAEDRAQQQIKVQDAKDVLTIGAVGLWGAMTQPFRK